MNGSENIPSPAQTPAPSPRGRALRRAGWILGGIALLYGMVALDVVLRARECYREGEKYSRWSEHPDEKHAALDAEFEREKARLDRDLSARRLTQDRHDLELENLKFDRDFKLQESSVKYAYIWYKTAYELFSPPESPWVKRSREKAALAKEKWKEELRAKKIPFEDYMLE
jgi:hypothetical protein